ncbi:hypothetical protein [Peribacillus aracenensis]|uniref:hypothetical protein n=1 Tax=Peribacillus aracenensis TaxID=2976708 RepID=UPI0021A36B26|nr:hypothetical protein [Peribacillus sp. BBB004]
MKSQPKPQRKMVYKMKWSVNPHRKDKRTGAISPVPMSPYTKYAFEEIERQFRR